MYLTDVGLVLSASDLTAAATCELAFLRTLDARLGRLAEQTAAPDPMLARTATLGTEHEVRVLRDYEEQFGAARRASAGRGGVVTVERPALHDPDAVAAAVDATRAAFAADADVVYQAVFAEPPGGADESGQGPARPGFVGFADFVVRRPDGRYRIQDSKLARHARVTALLQLAAYAVRLRALGVPVDDDVDLILGDGTVSTHRLADVEPVYRLRRAHLERLVTTHLADPGPAAWGDPRWAVCGRCTVCDAEATAHRDVLLVAGLRRGQRDRLAQAGVTTIDALAASTGPVEGIAVTTLAGLREQAALQVESEREAGKAAGSHPAPAVRVVDASGLAVIPEPDAGDVFFDFEGDPLYTEGDGTRWGLDYLFGLVEADGTFRAWWAHSFEQEKQALLGFLDYLRERRRRHPGLHVYHYASYERTHLLALAARHGVGEHEVDQVLREHVLVDLYPVVRRTVRVGSRSYSIKKLEPLYMGDDLRAGEVQTAAASIDEYAAARAAVERGDAAQGRALLDAIADYNTYDCRSTLRLRDWLLRLAHEHGVRPAPEAEAAPGPEVEASPLAARLAALAGDPMDPHRTADQRALGLAAAAIDYHRREQKSFWWGHFSRLVEPLADWEGTRDVMRVDGVRVLRDWFRDKGQRTDRRVLELRGEWGPGSRPVVGSRPYLLYEDPGPYPDAASDPGARSARGVGVTEVIDDATVVVTETLPQGAEGHADTPSALTPGPPPNAGAQVGAIAEWATALADAVEPASVGGVGPASVGGVGPAGRREAAAPAETTPLAAGTPAPVGSAVGAPASRPSPESGLLAAAVWPRDAVVDLLRRAAPRTRAGGLAPVRPGPDGEDDLHGAVVATLRDLDDSYLAVQGPPGTGKTYLAGHVVRTLVERYHWRIGVVAQSHAVVENVLDGVVRAGLDPALVGKEPNDPEAGPAFTAVPRTRYAEFCAERATSGFVLGGTAWDFANPGRVGRRSLDLLVVDEAGQYSLGTTIAAAVAARNLLLLGDPQQLPQVSQGTHPEPVDTSALGWLADGHDVLPTGLGYFLAASRRMHPAVSQPVSELSYEGRLHSHPTASLRALDGVTPGLHVHPVRHAGRSTESPEEAQAVVEIVRSVVGRWWRTGPEDTGRALTPADVVVVTPYNAQVLCVRAALDGARLGAARVGTVDKFQGQEAAVAIVTLAASDAGEVPRGMEFLLMKNRLNVAISRAQWAAWLVWSPALLDHLPTTPAALAQLSAFARLVGEGPRNGREDR
ncbi:TM0106 family RecB-like putative nuclease [Xylanimonas allomyrinae]|uniref:TM0106 family RecB-like putative nuclease n=1 Tax=Xylanimonas allomyrinae TaxID=2509459 RepID=A0A4P6EUF5_9MICO|nr:TM0106 family RecB-like putative nuclease [Xylanimonas allomyrinae]QAY64067.1 TM0106 family RecB-like putative nuclease [Xylanimonas allomyrinae]